MRTSLLLSVVTRQKTFVYSHWKTTRIPHVVIHTYMHIAQTNVLQVCLSILMIQNHSDLFNFNRLTGSDWLSLHITFIYDSPVGSIHII
jgi:hypothetical protein